MMKALFGSQSAAQILLFLLVNEQCYAHQLQRVLSLAITPAQKALARLEKGKILISQFQGKIRMYQFNPEYPFLIELKELIKRIYNHLSLDEKKRYYYLTYEQKNEKKQINELFKVIWDHLQNVSQMTLMARSGSCFRKGKGNVIVEQSGQSLIFHEQGNWQGNEGKYQNRFRWTWDRAKGLLTLEHLRFGEDYPVFLFDLHPARGNMLKSLCPHLQGKDTYFGWMECGKLFLHLHIRTLGPTKDEKVEYAYV